MSRYLKFIYCSRTGIVSEDKQLTNELHRPITRKFKKHNIYSSFRDNIWGTDLVDLQLRSECNRGVRFLLCVIDIYSKYAWNVPLKDKKGIKISMVVN